MIVKVFLSHQRVDANQASPDNGTTPLYMACQDGHDAVVKLLLAHGEVGANKARTG